MPPRRHPLGRRSQTCNRHDPAPARAERDWRRRGGSRLALWRRSRVGAPGWSRDPRPPSIPKFETALVIPPPMPRATGRATGVDYYEIAVRQFRQHVLPPSMGLRPTTVWSYGSPDHAESFNYPAFTIEARWRRPVRVKWMNQLVKPNGEFRPHLLAIDQTLHWANPPGGRAWM